MRPSTDLLPFFMSTRGGSSMKLQKVAVACVLAGPLFFSATARAGDNGPCGNFDFSGNVSCKIEVQGGCTASCDAPKLTVACGGKCTTQSTQTCNDTCGTQCVAQCDPSLLDCFSGCHAECDQPTIDICTQKHPG